MGATSGDAIGIDAVQLEQTATIPAWGSTGGSGGGVLTFDGGWEGPKLAAASADDYGRNQAIRTGDVTEAAFGSLGAATDSQLTGSFVVDVGVQD